MFLHIGNSKIVFNNELIGIFNYNSAESSRNYEVLQTASFEAIHNNVKADSDQPKSFIVTDKDIFVSPISPLTLSKRHKTSR